MPEYLEAIERRVCSVCIDGIHEDVRKSVRCGLPKDRTCPIERHLPQVIEVVESIDSPWMDDYVDALRGKVCSDCEQTEAGICDFRLKADCALDTYFMLVAEAIEEVRDRKKNFPQGDPADASTKRS